MKWQENNTQVNTTKRKLGKRFTLIFLIGMALNQSFAQSQFEIKTHTINSGGGTSIGGGFSLNASIGQVDASNTISGGSYSLNGGIWHKTQPTNTEELIFNNGFE